MSDDRIGNIRVSARELHQCIPDFVAGWLQGAPRGGEPLADHLIENEIGLRQVAEFWGARALREKKGKTDPSPRAAVGAATTSSSFNTQLAHGVREYVFRRLAATTIHRDICEPVTARDFKNVEFPQITTTPPMRQIEKGDDPWPVVSFSVESMVTQALERWGTLLIVSREAIINDDWALIRRTTDSIVEHALMLEHKAVMGELESPSELGDGEAFYSKDAGNLVTGQGFGPEGVGAGMSALRRQPVEGGEPANYQARWLVIHPDHEREAMQIVREMSTGRPALNLVVSPHIKASRFYVLSDRQIATPLAFLTFDPNERRQATVTVQSVEPNAVPFTYEGAALRIDASFAAKAITRAGGVRVQAAE